MDPNEALRRLRLLVARMGNAVDKGREVSPDDAWAAMETFYGLDRWLSSGGFLPEDWERTRKAVST